MTKHDEDKQRGLSAGAAIAKVLALKPEYVGVRSDLPGRLDELGARDRLFADAYLGVWNVPEAVFRAYVTASPDMNVALYQEQVVAGHRRAEALLASPSFEAIVRDYREISACPVCGTPRSFGALGGRMYFDECVPCGHMQRRGELMNWRGKIKPVWLERLSTKVGVRHWRKRVEPLEVVREFAAGSKCREVVFLHGRPGTGKTQQAIEFMRCLVPRYLARLTHNDLVCHNGGIPTMPSVVFVTESEMLKSLRPDGGKTTEDYKHVAQLIIDDIGACKGSSFALEEMEEVFNHRYSKNLPTFITSNFTIDELSTRSFYSDRFTSRLMEATGFADPEDEEWDGLEGVVEMTTNYRQRRRA